MVGWLIKKKDSLSLNVLHVVSHCEVTFHVIELNRGSANLQKVVRPIFLAREKWYGQQYLWPFFFNLQSNKQTQNTHTKANEVQIKNKVGSRGQGMRWSQAEP